MIYSESMNEKFPLALTAARIAEPARAAMLTVLLDARSRSAGELARVERQIPKLHSDRCGSFGRDGLLNRWTETRENEDFVAPTVNNAVLVPRILVIDDNGSRGR